MAKCLDLDGSLIPDNPFPDLDNLNGYYIDDDGDLWVFQVDEGDSIMIGPAVENQDLIDAIEEMGR